MLGKQRLQSYFFSQLLTSQLMPIQLYIDYISQPSRTVLAFCKISRIPVVIHEVRIAKLQHLSEEYSAVNPMKKVPAIVDPQNALSLGESHAIIAYLTRKHKLDHLWGLTDELHRAKVNQYLHYHHLNTRKCAFLLYTEVFSRLYPVGQGSSPSGESLRQEIKGVLDFMEEHYFLQSCFLIGPSLTAADLSAYFQIQSLAVVDFDLSPWSKIAAWVSLLSAMTQIKETNSSFLRLLPKIKKSPKPSL